jgi:hypothetical protein
VSQRRERLIERLCHSAEDDAHRKVFVRAAIEVGLSQDPFECQPTTLENSTKARVIRMGQRLDPLDLFRCRQTRHEHGDGLARESLATILRLEDPVASLESLLTAGRR